MIGLDRWQQQQMQQQTLKNIKHHIHLNSKHPTTNIKALTSNITTTNIRPTKNRTTNTRIKTSEQQAL